MKQKRIKKSDTDKIKEIDDAYVDAARYVMRNAKPPVIVRKAGQLNEVEVDGRKIFRQDKIYIGEGKIPEQDIGWVKCQETDNHFVYRDAHRLGWTLFCTCGSPSVVVNSDVYKDLASPQGAMLICMSLLYNRRHQDGGM